MLLLFAGTNYYPSGGWDDFVRVIASLDEIEIKERRDTYETQERSYRTFRSDGEHVEVVPSRTITNLYREINVFDSDGMQYDWWHVVDTDTMKIVATSRPDEESG